MRVVSGTLLLRVEIDELITYTDSHSVLHDVDPCSVPGDADEVSLEVWVAAESNSPSLISAHQPFSRLS